jgi:DNA-directed RNA polymerase subunit M/transcription elongation factor TFIIS
MKKEEKVDLMQAEEERCPKCDSNKVERTGGSHQVMGIVKNIGYKCECGHVFHIYEHYLKSLQ